MRPLGRSYPELPGPELRARIFATMPRDEIRIAIPGADSVSAIVDAPVRPLCAYVFGHGAGAGMRHAFMEQLAMRLAARGSAVLRYQFPAMERQSRRPDSPQTAQAAVRAAVQSANQRWADLPLFAGGKSFGGRMTSQAQALEPLPRVLGLEFVGFPLHAAGAPSTKRAQHLDAVAIPMLFLQGTRDLLADLDLVQGVVRAIPLAELSEIDDADHAFHVRRSSGSNDGAVLDRLADTMVAWMIRHATPSSA